MTPWSCLSADGRRATSHLWRTCLSTGQQYICAPRRHDLSLQRAADVFGFRRFGVLGAIGRQGQITFDAWRISLAEAMAKARGVNDVQGDPAAVFLYRGEMREVAERLGIDCSKFSGPIIPVIYNLNLREPAGFFLAANFEVRNKDVIFIANAVSVEVTKFLTFLRTIMATVNDPLIYATNYYTLLNVSKGVANRPIVTTPTPIATPD